VEVSVRSGWVEQVNLFTVTAMDPGNRKSPVFRAATAPIESAERAQAVQQAPEIIAAKVHADAAQRRLHQAEAALAKASPEDRAECQKALEQCIQDVLEIKVPTPARLLADDVTAEKLMSLLAEQDGRLAVMSAEGDIFDTMAGRYGASGMANFGVFLKGHPGDSIRVDRTSRPSEYIERPALTLCLTVQPEVIRGLHARPEFRDRGLLSRFFFSLPVSLMGRRKIRPRPMQAEVRDGYTRAIEKLLALPLSRDATGSIQTQELRLSRDADDALEDFEREMEPKLHPLGELAHMTDWASKLAGAVIRVAGLLHMATYWRESSPAPWERPIDSETMDCAIQIGHYLLGHAQVAYGLMGADPEIERAKFLLSWLTAQQKTSLTLRDLFQGTKGRFRRVEAMRPALAILVDRGFLRPRVQPSHPGPGRKPSPVYEVNPLVDSQNSQNSQNPRDVQGAGPHGGQNE
jgi:hypothetical protein